MESSVKNERVVVGLAVFSAIGTMASIYSAWIAGQQPLWARLVGATAMAVLLVLVVLLLRIIAPVLRKNARHVNLVEAIRTVGMSDVESRDEGDRHLPPAAIYGWPGLREICITGITAASSFRSHLSSIKSVLANKADVYFIICSEETADTEKMDNLERRNVSIEFQEVREVIAREKLSSDERFHIRCFATLPTFTALMINGDLVPHPDHRLPQDSRGIIRIQPRRMESTHHDGIVLQFENDHGRADGFRLFAEDLRKQWKEAKEWR
jgi:hypothetical protein